MHGESFSFVKQQERQGKKMTMAALFKASTRHRYSSKFPTGIIPKQTLSRRQLCLTWLMAG
jgi:hypothetical protein